MTYLANIGSMCLQFSFIPNHFTTILCLEEYRPQCVAYFNITTQKNTEEKQGKVFDLVTEIHFNNIALPDSRLLVLV